MNRLTRNSRFSATMLALATLSCLSIDAAGTASAENPTGTSAPEPRAPVSYLVLEKSLIGNEIHEAGTTALYDGLPAANLQPTCDEGRRRAAEFIASDKARVAQLVENNRDGAAGDPTEFMKNLVKMQQEQAAEQAKAAAEQQAKLGETIGQAVATGIAQALATMFPNGIPSAAPAAPAAPAAEAPATPADQAAADTGADAGTPVKRKGSAAAS